MFKIILVLLMVQISEILAFGVVNSAIVPTDRLNKSDWSKRHLEIMDEVTSTKKKILFLGDSITQGWMFCSSWNRHFKYRAVNAGISGDRTQNVLWRLQQGLVRKMQPELVVLLIGTNNTLSNSSVQIADGVLAIINEIRAQKFDVKILLHAVLPSGETKDKPRRIANNELNLILENLAQKENIFYVDFSHHFVADSGSILPTTMPDYLHPTTSAYSTWSELLSPKINLILGEPLVTTSEVGNVSVRKSSGPN